MLQKFAMVKYGVFVAKICKHALCASAVRDIWWSPLARQLLPTWHFDGIAKHCSREKALILDQDRCAPTQSRQLLANPALFPEPWTVRTKTSSTTMDTLGNAAAADVTLT